MVHLSTFSREWAARPPLLVTLRVPRFSLVSPEFQMKRSHGVVEIAS
jgi:hypothetical protein